MKKILLFALLSLIAFASFSQARCDREVIFMSPQGDTLKSYYHVEYLISGKISFRTIVSPLFKDELLIYSRNGFDESNYDTINGRYYAFITIDKYDSNWKIVGSYDRCLSVFGFKENTEEKLKYGSIKVNGIYDEYVSGKYNYIYTIMLSDGSLQTIKIDNIKG